jgi:hypothetical protein
LQHLGGCSLLFQCLSEVLLGLGEFAGSLVELLLEVDSGEIAISRDRWRFSALELRCRTADVSSLLRRPSLRQLNE